MIKIELQEIEPGQFEAIATLDENEFAFVSDERELLPRFVSRVYLAMHQKKNDRKRFSA